MKWLSPLAALATLGACNERAPEFAGIGQWRFTRTVRADAKAGVCQPTELTDGRKATWCYALPPYRIAPRSGQEAGPPGSVTRGRVAEVDLYFNGTDDKAPLIEIQLKVRGCVEEELETWMRQNFGPPIESKPTRGYWKNSFLWAAALMPADPGRCIVHFLPLDEAAEIARIKQK